MKINSSKEKSLPTSWVEVAADGFKSGVYKTHLGRFSATPFDVICNKETDLSGGLVIQRRIGETLNINSYWQAYKDDYGDLAGNYWRSQRAMNRSFILNWKHFTLQKSTRDIKSLLLIANLMIMR